MIHWLRRLSGRGRVLGGAILLALLALRVWDPDPVTIVRDRAFDFYQVIQPRPAADTAVLVVDLDEASLAEFGQWPWPRTLVADLLANLFNAGAVVVGFDVVFAEPDRLSPDRIANQFVGLSGDTKAELQALPSNDAILADVFRQTRVVVGRAALPEPTAQQNTVAPARPAIANVGGDPDPFLPEFAGMLRNIPELESTAAGHGMLSLTPELDGIVRRVPALLKVDGKIYPTFALEVLRVATGQTAMAIRTNEAGVDSVVIAGARIPTDRNGRLWVHYAKRTGDRVVSAASVLNRTAPDETIAGKLVLVGTSAVGLQDIKTTTLEGGVPGVEIHAQILDMILAQSFLIRPNFALGLELGVTLIVALIVIGLVPAVGAIWTLLVGGFVALVLIPDFSRGVFEALDLRVIGLI